MKKSDPLPVEPCMSYKEIARQLGINDTTVKKLEQSGLKKLRAFMRFHKIGVNEWI